MEIQPIVMDDACSENNQDKVVAYSVVFPHMYKGKSVDKENLIAIVDEQGVKYTAINWGKVKEGVQR